MKTKKYKHADLERKRSIFFQIGLIVALGCAFAAFEWTMQDANILIMPVADEFVEQLDLPKVIKLEEKKPEPVKKQELLEEIIKITNDDDPNADTPDFTTEATEETSVLDIPELPTEEADDEVHVFVERMPEFPGGMEALMQFLASNIKYPVICAELGIEGKVYVGFVVDKKGIVTNVHVMRSPDANLSKEAIRVVSMTPRWSPGKQGGKPVKVAYTVPVNFKLQK